MSLTSGCHPPQNSAFGAGQIPVVPGDAPGGSRTKELNLFKSQPGVQTGLSSRSSSVKVVGGSSAEVTFSAFIQGLQFPALSRDQPHPALLPSLLLPPGLWLRFQIFLQQLSSICLLVGSSSDGTGRKAGTLWSCCWHPEISLLLQVPPSGGFLHPSAAGACPGAFLYPGRAADAGQVQE